MHKEAEAPQNFSLKVWSKMLRFIRPYYKTLAWVFGLMLLLALVDISIPLFLREAINRFVQPGTVEGVGGYIAIYLSVLAVQTVMVVAMARGAMNIEMKLGRDLKRATFVHLQTLDFSYYNQNAEAGYWPG